MKYQLIPYVFNGISWNLADDMIRGAYLKMAGHDLVETVFPDGKVNTPDAFLQLAKRPGNVLHIILDGKELVLWAYLNTFGRNHAFAHFCTFPEVWGGKADELGRMSLEYWFGVQGREPESKLFDLICGRVPATNRRAVEYIQRLGFTTLPEIPKMIWDDYQQAAVGAVFCYIEREA